MSEEPEIIDVEPVKPRTSSAIARWEPSAIASMTDAEFSERVTLMRRELDRLREVQRKVMTDGSDYDVIPGTKKPSLLKPGAEVLNKMAGLVPSYIVTPTFGDGETGPHIHYVVQCTLHVGSQDGPAKASGVGSCNSWERKYRWRQVDRKCPKCDAPAIIKGKEEYGGGWVCWKNKKSTPGCGAKFKDGDPLIEGQSIEDVENPDPFDLDNTLLKMAKKRAYLDATLSEHAGSGLFTQDLEDAKKAAEQQSKRADRAPDDDRWDSGELDSLVKGKDRKKPPAEAAPKVGEVAVNPGAGPPPKPSASVGEPAWLDDPMPSVGRKGWAGKPWRWMLEAPGDQSERWQWMSGILDSPTAAKALKDPCEWILNELHKRRQAAARAERQG